MLLSFLLVHWESEAEVKLEHLITFRDSQEACGMISPSCVFDLMDLTYICLKECSFFFFLLTYYTVCPRKSGYECMCRYLTKYFLYIDMIIIYIVATSFSNQLQQTPARLVAYFSRYDAIRKQLYNDERPVKGSNGHETPF